MSTLIAYSTRYGSTEKVAKKLRAKLIDPVDIIDLKEFHNPDVSNYELIILGGGIYFGKTQKNLKDFLKNNLDILKTKKIGLFLCAGEKDPEVKQSLIKKNFPKELRDSSLATDILGHAIRIDVLTFSEKILVKYLKGVTESYEEFYEEKIEDFAEKINNSIN
jgi:menaquinone-dependent protoporphyrinogen oxidase